MRALLEYRELARQLLEHATNGAHGRPESDPVYQRVVEGRDPGVGKPGDISSCGFLPSWLWFRLGIRCSFVNRGENQRYGYRVGQNISLLCGPRFGGADSVPTTALRSPSQGSRFSCGDVLVVWTRPDTTDAHTCVVLEHMDGAILTADYGQPGGALKTRPLTVREAHDDVTGRAYPALFLGQKEIRRWAPLDAVLHVAQERGELVEPDISMLAPLPPKSTPDAAQLDRRPTLREGDRAPVVAELQSLLNRSGARPPLMVDGHFGAKTRDALKAFQKLRMLKPDAVCGPITWAALLQGGS